MQINVRSFKPTWLAGVIVSNFEAVCTTVYTSTMERIGIRELRQDLSNQVKNAARGEPVVITVDGEPKAKLVPLGAPAGEETLDDLIAKGRVIPGRPSSYRPSGFKRVEVKRSSKEILDEIRADRF